MKTILVAILFLVGCTSTPTKTVHQAAEDGDLAALQSLLNKDARLVDAPDERNRNWTPLHYAANAEIAQLLLQNGADPKTKGRLGWTPLHTAATVEVARLLLKQGADPSAKAQKGLTPMHAARTGEIVSLLHEAGASIYNAPDPSRQHPRKETPLYWAVHKNRSSTIKALLKYGANVSQKLDNGRPLISFAAERGYVDVIRVLAAHSGVHKKDENGAAPIHYAVINDKVDAAKVLLEAGAKVNARLPKGVTVGTTTFSGEFGSSTSQRNIGGKTPLGLADSDSMRAVLKKFGGTT